MPTTESSAYVSPIVREAVSTGAVTGARITLDYGRKDETFQEWQSVIEDQLVEWGKNPSQFEDEDIQPLSNDTISAAIAVAKAFSMADFPPPTRVVPDADAGIVFELQHGPFFETFRLSADGSAQYCFFENARLVDSKFWPPRGA
jgi:hypothetical protein